ncbi:hypothetical protein Tco_0857547 [Tanacetum coccineum]|uniref:Zinc finger, CCHC-type n=1 Tax=Tanacetum coccineum TaxID=301880 RepID=A0ABQ5B6Q2_9ASTR
MLAPKSSTYNGRPTFVNPMYLKKAQFEKPCLYEIPYDKSDLANVFVPDREETLTLLAYKTISTIEHKLSRVALLDTPSKLNHAANLPCSLFANLIRIAVLTDLAVLSDTRPDLVSTACGTMLLFGLRYSANLYDSWKSRMELYMQSREHGKMILESVENGLLIWPTVEENGVIKTKKYAELSAAEKIQADCDMKVTNIILQGLPADIYSLMNHHRERECKLYDAFDKFTHIKGETLHKYYLRFIQLINDMNIYNMKIEQFQVNTKFLNSLPPEWIKFVTGVKLMKDLHTTNFDQLHAYLEQHELHANEVRILRERNQDPLAFVSNQQMTPPHFNTYQSSYNNPQLQ